MDQISDQKIMIVGKDSHFSYWLQRFVRTSAHRFIPVNLSDDVLSLARCEKPVAILLEVDTPETVGWQMLRTLKSDPEVAKIPVIAYSWQDESTRGLAEGVAVYLQMPIVYSDFEAALTAIRTKEENDQSS